MRRVLLLLPVATFVVAGCPKPEPIQVSNVAELGGLEIRLDLPKTEFLANERFTAKVTARNVSDVPILIPAKSSAPVWIRLHAYTALYLETIKQYPKSVVPVHNEWTLEPGASRSFPVELLVEPDWPRGELLQLTGCLNGRPEVFAGMVISVRERPLEDVPGPWTPVEDAGEAIRATTPATGPSETQPATDAAE